MLNNNGLEECEADALLHRYENLVIVSIRTKATGEHIPIESQNQPYLQLPRRSGVFEEGCIVCSLYMLGNIAVKHIFVATRLLLRATPVIHSLDHAGNSENRAQLSLNQHMGALKSGFDDAR
jgi:hypothetical protein